MNQKEKDKRGMREAFEAARNSTCIRMSVGAVIQAVDKTPHGDRLYYIGTGWNGVPEGCIQCASKGCVRLQQDIPSGTRAETCRGLHAEQRALIDAIDGEYFLHKEATLYCTHHPCSICAKLIIAAGIKEVVYGVDYPDELAKELFAEAKVTVRHFEEE